MSYNIGQLKKSQISSFYTDLTNSITLQDNIITFSHDGQETQLYEYAKGVLNNSSFDKDECYYLSFNIALKSLTQNFELKLKNSITGQEQFLESYYMGTGSGRTNLEIVFSPNDDGYDQFIWELQRDPADFQINSNNIQGKQLHLGINTFGQLINIIDSILPTTITKIGIQGPSALLMCINEEQIRIGKSGIYEISGIPISYLAFVPKENDYFIVDYQYDSTAAATASRLRSAATASTSNSESGSSSTTPTVLPNPYAVNIYGDSYDGSAPVTIVADNEINGSSSKPVQNRAIESYIADIVGDIDEVLGNINENIIGGQQSPT